MWTRAVDSGSARAAARGSDSSVGIFGRSTSNIGVLGISKTQPGVLGTSKSSYGVHGAGYSGDGVYGESDLGRGGRFKGKKAQIKLVPSATAIHPTRGARGDFFVDKSGRLWFCKGGANWHQLA